MNPRLAAVLLLAPRLAAAQSPPPILDVHVHAPRVSDFAALAGGKPPLPHCVPMTDLPVPESGSRWPEVLIRHPRLRVFVMHAGWPMLDDLLALLWTHPQVYVELGAIDWALPRPEFHRYLQRIVEAGFGKRVMFGSDQMIWPEAIEMAIEGVESAPFLTAGQKRDIFYNNAARFLRRPDDAAGGRQGP